MRQLFQKHQDWFLGGVAVLLLAAIIGFFAWGVGVLVANLNRATNVESNAQSTVEFDAGKAEGVLRARGLLP